MIEISPDHYAEAVMLVAPGRPFLLDPENYDGLTMLDDGPKPTREEIETAWANRPTPPKVWPSVESFVEEFTLEECAAIELSPDPQIAALRFKLKTWRSTVHADHPLVVAGFAALVTTGILTEPRAAAILDNAA
jgi:hypothetical protein